MQRFCKVLQSTKHFVLLISKLQNQIMSQGNIETFVSRYYDVVQNILWQYKSFVDYYVTDLTLTLASKA